VNAASGIQKMLLDMLLKGTIILFTAGIACLLLRKAAAAVRSMVWSLAMISLLLLPVLSGILPHWQARILPAETIEIPVYETSMVTDSGSIPVADHIEYTEMEVAQGYTGSLAIESKLECAAVTPISVAKQAEKHTILQRFSAVLSSMTVQNWLCIIWGTGAVCALFPALSGLIWITFNSRRGACIVTGRMADIMQKNLETLHIRRPVRLLQWNGRRKLTMPTTWGIFRPVIVMPCEADDWPEARIRVAIMHELAHVQRMDWPAQILSRLVCAVYWFNPLVWFACRTMRMECERSCDDAVLQAGHTGTDYAEHLLDIVKSMCVKRHTALVTIPMARVSTVESRIRAILDGTRKRWSLPRWTVLGIGVITISMLIPFAAMQAVARTIQTIRKTGTVMDEGTNSTTVVSNTVIVKTIEPTGTSSITNESVSVNVESPETRSTETYSLSFEVSGRIIAVTAEGSVVTNGEVLAQLDSGRAWLSIETARTEITRKEAANRLTKQKYENFRNMEKAGLITAEKLDESEMKYIMAKADLKEARLALNKAELNLEACYLRAPVNGMIQKVHTHPGVVIQPGKPILRFSHERGSITHALEREHHYLTRKKVTVKHIETETPEQPVISNYVRLVVGPEKMTFEGKDVTWDALALALEKITDRPSTVLEFAQLNIANPDLIAFGKVLSMARKYNLDHVSDIGEKPLGSKGTVCYAGAYETGRIIPMALSAGITDAAGIVTTKSITFTTGENGTIKAVIDYNLLSGPKSRWWIALSLMDDKGQEIANDRTVIENSGIIRGLSISESKKAVFYFGDSEKSNTITRFRVSISQGFVPPEQVMISSLIIVKEGEKETIISQPKLAVHTDKEAEMYIGSQKVVPGKMIDTGIKITILPTIQNGILVVRGKVILTELAGISSNSVNKNTSLTWHSVKENTTEFRIKVKDQGKQYTVGPIPYKEDKELMFKMNATVMKSHKTTGRTE